MSGTIKFCENREVINANSVSSSTTGDPFAGGIAGVNNGTIINCSNQSNIGCQENSTNPTVIYIGGIAGSNNNDIINSFSICSLTGDAKPYTGAETNIGGISGINSGRITNSYSIADFTASAITLNKGGITGKGYGNVTNCYFLAGYAAGTGSALPLASFKDNTLTQYLNEYINSIQEQEAFSYWTIKNIYPDFAESVMKQTYSAGHQIEGNGTIEIPSTALPGEIVYFTVIPSQGYVLSSLFIQNVDIENIDQVHYSFVMPNNNIEIIAEFAVTTKIKNVENGLDVYINNNNLIVNSNKEQDVIIYLLNGSIFQIIKATIGNSIIPLDKGIYIVNGKILSTQN
jgi:hypothetical protein